jgi:hypothetical protein
LPLPEGGKSGKIGGKSGKIGGKNGKGRGKNSKGRGKGGKGGNQNLTPTPFPAREGAVGRGEDFPRPKPKQIETRYAVVKVPIHHG